ncbi:uncharacterized protein LOC130291238 isoform X2 [Hyla sarda]|uniref:uncharacterized protein LOC130291238 isoform X2 n=1 Tax=Hyla sarda TaxID=327740 RepID=UPI0024C2E2F0|nr:uncharacterized protein LOC130291238 isoform X2 [Hyla sarda]
MKKWACGLSLILIAPYGRNGNRLGAPILPIHNINTQLDITLILLTTCSLLINTGTTNSAPLPGTSPVTGSTGMTRAGYLWWPTRDNPTRVHRLVPIPGILHVTLCYEKPTRRLQCHHRESLPETKWRPTSPILQRACAENEASGLHGYSARDCSCGFVVIRHFRLPHGIASCVGGRRAMPCCANRKPSAG